MKNDRFIADLLACLEGEKAFRTFSLLCACTTQPTSFEQRAIYALNEYLRGAIPIEHLHRHSESLRSRVSASFIGIRIGDPSVMTVKATMAAISGAFFLPPSRGNCIDYTPKIESQELVLRWGSIPT